MIAEPYGMSGRLCPQQLLNEVRIDRERYRFPASSLWLRTWTRSGSTRARAGAVSRSASSLAAPAVILLTGNCLTVKVCFASLAPGRGGQSSLSPIISCFYVL